MLVNIVNEAAKNKKAGKKNPSDLQLRLEAIIKDEK